jgi:hypothetical protein
MIRGIRKNLEGKKIGKSTFIPQMGSCTSTRYVERSWHCLHTSICSLLYMEKAQRKRGFVRLLVSFIHASRPQRSTATHPALESSD